VTKEWTKKEQADLYKHLVTVGLPEVEGESMNSMKVMEQLKEAANVKRKTPELIAGSY
jgi:hypothetical protein